MKACLDETSDMVVAEEDKRPNDVRTAFLAMAPELEGKDKHLDGSTGRMELTEGRRIV